MKGVIGVAAVLVFTALASVPGTAAAAPADPWYEDVHTGFWAHGEIRILWEEECADGWVSVRYRWTPRGRRRETYALFRPDDPISRAQYAFLMAKTFRLEPVQAPVPTFGDVPRDFELYGDKPAYGHIQALAARGWVMGTGGGRFLPDDSIERQHAVAILVRSLGLRPFARAMAAEADRYLARFPDGRRVDASVKAEMALAIRLGIIIGYDDGTLRPGDRLLRCQAAALMVRSALIDVNADPPRLSPDGDGVEDTAAFTFRTLKNRSTRKWSLSVGNLEGEWYRSFYPAGREGEPPPILTWDGRDDRGRPLPDGTYFYQAWIRDSRGEVWRSALKPITLERRRLSGYLQPLEVFPGDRLGIRAHTTGGARQVTAGTETGPIDLSPTLPPADVGENDWLGSFRVPEGPEGPRTVRLLALFAGTSRALDLEYYLRDPLTLTGALDPNPARAGERLRVLAFTSTNVTRVRAELPWGEAVSLREGDPGRWEARARIPPETPDGRHPVVLEATAGTRRRQHTLWLTVEGSALADLTFVLSE